MHIKYTPEVKGNFKCQDTIHFWDQSSAGPYIKAHRGGGVICSTASSPQTQLVLPRESVDGLHQVLKCKPSDDSRDHWTAKAGKAQNDSIADRE